MNRLLGAIVFVSLSSAISVSSTPVPRIDITPVEMTAPDSLILIPWIVPTDSSWHGAKPQVVVKDSAGAITAKGWLAVTDSAILVHLVVFDDKQINARRDGYIWDGDAVQFGIDARGLGSGKLPANTRVTLPGTASLGVALTDKGPQAWAFSHGRPGGEGDVSYLIKSIVRNDSARQTIYDLNMPWKEFQTAAGYSPVIGMCFEINNADAKPAKGELSTKQKRSYWARGVEGELAPGKFRRLRLGAPPNTFASVTPLRTDLWRPFDGAEFGVSVFAKQPGVLNVSFMGVNKEQAIAAAPCKRFSVRLSPGSLPGGGAPVSFTISSGAVKPAKDSFAIALKGMAIDTLEQLADSLAMSSPNPLFTRHLQSVRSIAATNWAYALALLDINPVATYEPDVQIQRIVGALRGPAGKWAYYRDSTMELRFTFSSSEDRSLQSYGVVLPPKWDSTKTYPLIVYLHGSWTNEPLVPLSSVMMRANADADRPTDSVAVPPVECIRILPWGRGNAGYRDFAGADVFQSVDDAMKTFHIDPKRCYLMGHSMGGFGTWNLATHSPDRWAAIAICAGGTRGSAYLAGNLAHVPVLIFHGTADGSVPIANAYETKKVLEQYGNKPEMWIREGVGHTVPWHDYVAIMRWMLAKTIAPADSFTFATDAERFPGRNGIVMRRDPTVSGLPSFSCYVKSDTLRIGSTGAPSLTVDLGPKGLNRTKPTVLVWNGKTVKTAAPGEVDTLKTEPVK